MAPEVAERNRVSRLKTVVLPASFAFVSPRVSRITSSVMQRPAATLIRALGALEKLWTNGGSHSFDEVLEPRTGLTEAGVPPRSCFLPRQSSRLRWGPHRVLDGVSQGREHSCRAPRATRDELAEIACEWPSAPGYQ